MSEPGYAKPSISLPPELRDAIDDSRGNTFRSTWLQTSARQRLAIERGAGRAGVDTDELEDGWWEEFLEQRTYEYLLERELAEIKAEAD